MNFPVELSTLPASRAIGRNGRLSVLVALASYGTSNNSHLDRLIREYGSMPFDVDIVILSNIEKKPAPGIECRVGLPSKDPWSLPFAHKALFAERVDRYDLFIYSEDDILITEGQLRAFLEVTAALREDEVAGFIRMEQSLDGRISYPDMHDEFHWDPASLRSRAEFVLARFTNEHAACYVLTQSQLRKAIASGGFLVEPYEWKHDLLCTAATDPYIQCGFTKLVPVSRLDDFTVHHLSNKYAGKVGVTEAEMRAQVDTLLQLAAGPGAPAALLEGETKLWRRMYSKDYYERPSLDLIAAIPPGVRTVLSVGCGSGATECALAERGLQVVAVPLDPVVCGRAADKGVEMVFGDFRLATEKLRDQTFDCILFANVLHLVRDPVEVLSMFGGAMAENAVAIIQTPNMRCVPEMLRRLRHPHRYRGLESYHRSGVHISSIGKVRDWCGRSGLTVDRTVGMPHPRAAFVRGRSKFLDLAMSPNFIAVARKDASAKGARATP
ncbi:class I SAM-dependent methyltransferase [Rhodopseudomonas palustris]|uniref:class I SAM-dependent methyltransferase n=1 Tax=Rhodopseudomonas palustris TaxID=1076 RepID=UPI002ACD86D8|nr:class I SAM-dependent methyltransferase [Rhodopseudomonas palustris]WQG97533.1 class I SAM-dependent methyltransferase [Rhodopseudomonas palustris]